MVARRFINNSNAVNASLRTIREGHEIAHHSFDHSNFTNNVLNHSTSCGFLKLQMGYSDKLFREHLGISPRYFRPPYGEITPEILDVLENWHYKTIMWNLDTYDWYWDNDGRDRLEIVESYKEAFLPEPKAGSFITLQHDKGRNVEANAERYNYIIDIINHSGYKFVKLDECLEDREGSYFNSTFKPDFSHCGF